jgi:hypothetical protein
VQRAEGLAFETDAVGGRREADGCGCRCAAGACVRQSPPSASGARAAQEARTGYARQQPGPRRSQTRPQMMRRLDRSPSVPIPSSRYNTTSFISARFLPLHYAPGLQRAPGTPRPDRQSPRSAWVGLLKAAGDDLLVELGRFRRRPPRDRRGHLITLGWRSDAARVPVRSAAGQRDRGVGRHRRRRCRRCTRAADGRRRHEQATRPRMTRKLSNATVTSWSAKVPGFATADNWTSAELRVTGASHRGIHCPAWR